MAMFSAKMKSTKLLGLDLNNLLSTCYSEKAKGTIRRSLFCACDYLSTSKGTFLSVGFSSPPRLSRLLLSSVALLA